MNSPIVSPSGPLNATVTPPGSKSITNRVLPLAALAEGTSVLSGVLNSDDTRMMMDSLVQMGVSCTYSPDKATVEVRGTGGILRPADLFCGNSGTTLRFLTAICSLGNGPFRLDGIERMRQRPAGDLLRGLEQLGACARAEFANDCPPILVDANGLHGGVAKIPGNISSQFLSALLMAAPYAQNDTTLEVTGDLVSRPYIDMTLSVMNAFGVAVREEKPNAFFIPARQKYVARNYVVEPDASAASYFFAAVAVAGGQVTVENLSKNALQGDVRFCDCLAKMGCSVEYNERSITVRRDPSAPLCGIDTDMHNISDTAQTLSVVALFADSPTTICNVANMRVKETDRIHAVVCELQKFGVRVEEFPDGLKIWPLEKYPESGVRVETWNDHRMAMSFAVAGLRVPGVEILHPECTAKTYPNFWKDFDALRK